TEWSLAGDQFVKDHSQAEQIATPVQLLTANLLRRHIVRRSQEDPGLRFEHGSHRRVAGVIVPKFVFRQLSEPEVEHLGITVRAQYVVFRLDVAMNYARRMCSIERARNLNCDFENLIERQII